MPLPAPDAGRRLKRFAHIRLRLFYNGMIFRIDWDKRDWPFAADPLPKS
jgi:hypothetical protein